MHLADDLLYFSIISARISQFAFSRSDKMSSCLRTYSAIRKKVIDFLVFIWYFRKSPCREKQRFFLQIHRPRSRWMIQNVGKDMLELFLAL